MSDDVIKCTICRAESTRRKTYASVTIRIQYRRMDATETLAVCPACIGKFFDAILPDLLRKKLGN